MSEYQVIAFRAIDAPVSEKNLRFMERQSTRAEITPIGIEGWRHNPSAADLAFRDFSKE